MVANDKEFGSLNLPNTLELSPDHTVRVVGHLLRHHYGDSLDAIVPKRLQSLVAALDARERLSMHASDR
jgi:hypothetical protein